MFVLEVSDDDVKEEFSKFNDELEEKHKPRNWRNVVTSATNPVTADVKLFMESTVEFILVKGEVTTGKISVQEPQWMVNFKKALGAALKVKLPFQQAQSIPYLWVDMEQGIEEVCENTFQVTELPEHLIYEDKIDYQDLVPDKVGPDGLDTKHIHQVTPHKILEPAQLAKTTQEIWPGLQNKLMCDSSPCLKTSSYSLSVSILAESPLNLFCNQGQIS